MIKKLLVHSCCAPCSTATVEELIDQSEKLVLFYYNPNISPEKEEEKRFSELNDFIFNNYGRSIEVIRGEYNHKEWMELVSPLSFSGEGGMRCRFCYYLRLLKSFQTAVDINADGVTTTLSISPYKNYEWLDEIGILLSKRYGVKWFLKRWNYKRSVELSKQHGLYRQNYCGCEFSKVERAVK